MNPFMNLPGSGIGVGSVSPGLPPMPAPTGGPNIPAPGLGSPPTGVLGPAPGPIPMPPVPAPVANATPPQAPPILPGAGSAEAMMAKMGQNQMPMVRGPMPMVQPPMSMERGSMLDPRIHNSPMPFYFPPTR